MASRTPSASVSTKSATFSPDNPPPLNIPLIYFTKVTVVQAGQFGGTLTIPGLHRYTS
ncbi:hypothetical protein ACFWD7_30555 [Streptomyces mirabilis]|uniref:hypothetical protein n=1 Tax=Streptomyces mirabilis TaxID=68239 RepID=UPI0021BF59BD|nr:hypothetical protein [Streptomyces mirabilis]MCT9109362.1 hypothetical protein [Streptomyces mirabilis]